MKKASKNNFFVCATEQSGDNIGAKIISQLNLKKNKYIFDGVGGDKMIKLLNKQYYYLIDFKSIGIFEIISSIKKYLVMIEKLSEIILQNNYNTVITIDSPDFNFRLAKKIKKKGLHGKFIKVVAPTDLSSPLARAGLRIFAASMAPSVAPAPTRVWISSINKMI